MWITSRYKAHTQNTNGKCIYKYCHFFGILCPNTGTRLMVLPRLILFHIIFSAFLCLIHTRHRSNYAHTYIGNNGAEGKEEKKKYSWRVYENYEYMRERMADSKREENERQKERGKFRKEFDWKREIEMEKILYSCCANVNLRYKI